MVAWFVAVGRDARAETVDLERWRAALGPPAIAGLVALLFAGSAFSPGPPTTADALRTVAASAVGCWPSSSSSPRFGRRTRRGDELARPIRDPELNRELVIDRGHAGCRRCRVLASSTFSARG